MIGKDKFIPQFGDWWPYIEPFWEKGGFEEIYAHLKERSEKHYKIFPISKDLYRAFIATPYKDVRAVWMGMCPYHTIWKGEPIADGLAFSSNGEEQPPSLRVLYDAIEDDTEQLLLERPLKLDYLAQQGVLLLNASLTTEQGVAGKHHDLWAPFMKFLCKNVFDIFKGMPIIAFGKQADETLSPFMTNDHLYKYVYHPAYYARTKEPMAHEGVFTWTNKCIEGNNGEEFKIEYNYGNCPPF